MKAKYHSLLCLSPVLSLLLISCMSRTASGPNFIQNCHSLKKGMRLDQVLVVMGDPSQSITLPFGPNMEKAEQVSFSSWDRKTSYTLFAWFVRDELVSADLSITEDSYTDKKTLIEMDWTALHKK